MIDEKKLIESLRSSLNTGRETFPLDMIIDCIEEQPKVGEWIPADEPPRNNNYILLSFENFSLPMVGRYEDSEDGGAYYLDSSFDWIDDVVAWMPLPEPYRTEKENNPEWKDRMMQTFLGGRR